MDLAGYRMNDPNTSRATAKSGVFLSAGAWLHKFETAYVIVTLGVTMVSIVRSSRNMLEFAVISMLFSVGAAAVAMWPRMPRHWAVLAEAFLLLLLIGQWVGPNTTFLPVLNRDIDNASDWNGLPLAARRTLVWNIVGFFAFAWLSMPYLLFVADRPRGAKQWAARIAAVILVGPGLALLFATVLVGFFQT
jgi:hypothetical protein